MKNHKWPMKSILEKKMIHIVNSKGNASYNYLEISGHSSQNVYVHENKPLFVVRNVNLCSHHEDH